MRILEQWIFLFLCGYARGARTLASGPSVWRRAARTSSRGIPGKSRALMVSIARVGMTLSVTP